MSDSTQAEWHETTELIVSDDLRFKEKLNIGADAFTSNRARRAALDLWNAVSAAGTASVVATSAPVASTFFAPTGVLAFLGMGTAVTPIGWVAASGALAAIGWVGVARYLRQTSGSRTTEIPKFINSPIDVLALTLFDLMAPLALKVASADGEIHSTEREAIDRYFIDQWGFDAHFVREGIAFTENRLHDFKIDDLARALAALQLNNKDCNYKKMSDDLVTFLREIIEADGRIHPDEEVAIQEVKEAFRKAEHPILNLSKEKLALAASSTVMAGNVKINQITETLADRIPGLVEKGSKNPGR